MLFYTDRVGMCRFPRVCLAKVAHPKNVQDEDGSFRKSRPERISEYDPNVRDRLQIKPKGVNMQRQPNALPLHARVYVRAIPMALDELQRQHLKRQFQSPAPLGA